jgi:hypothetical protein
MQVVKKLSRRQFVVTVGILAVGLLGVKVERAGAYKRPLVLYAELAYVSPGVDASANGNIIVPGTILTGDDVLTITNAGGGSGTGWTVGWSDGTESSEW